ncbi:hypothetical protein [Gynuella sp.]|uniref:hypothetical protein n=1 Tax=Gynuella sp. TaxID=2969146 RepID=UPI003D0DBAE5
MKEYIKHDVYFMVTYPDKNLAYPVIESYVFIGRNIFGDEIGNTWYFQYSTSFGRYGSILDTEDGDRRIEEVKEEELISFLTREELEQELQQSEKRRNIPRA